MLGIILLTLRVLAAGALFLFLGWAFRLLWLDLKAQAGPIAAGIPELMLIPLVHPDHESYIPASAEVMIGRDPACDLHIIDQTISGQHARLVYRLSQWWVEDLQSTNGTFLNQAAVSHPIVLTSGDELRFGQVSYQVSISTVPSAITPSLIASNIEPTLKLPE